MSRLAVTGFCWGGRITRLYAAHQPELKAAVAWYGVDRPHGSLTPNNPVDVVPGLKCPVLALYGGADPNISRQIVEAWQAACHKDGKTCEYKVYPDVTGPKRPKTADARLVQEIRRRLNAAARAAVADRREHDLPNPANWLADRGHGPVANSGPASLPELAAAPRAN